MPEVLPARGPPLPPLQLLSDFPRLGAPRGDRRTPRGPRGDPGGGDFLVAPCAPPAPRTPGSRRDGRRGGGHVAAGSARRVERRRMTILAPGIQEAGLAQRASMRARTVAPAGRLGRLGACAASSEQRSRIAATLPTLFLCFPSPVSSTRLTIAGGAAPYACTIASKVCMTALGVCEATRPIRSNKSRLKRPRESFGTLSRKHSDIRLQSSAMFSKAFSSNRLPANSKLAM